MPAPRKDRRTKHRVEKGPVEKGPVEKGPVEKNRVEEGRPKRRRPLLRRVGTWLGIAGVLGVAAGGVLVARDTRQRQAYTPEQVRQRLHERARRSAGEH